MSGPGARCTFSGAVLTAAAALAGLAAAWWLARYEADRPEPDPRRAPANERAALAAVRRIAAAQERYRRTDWDGDGTLAYAHYVAHLWQTPGPDGRPVRLGLIPRRLAFAMGPAQAADGYFFRTLGTRESTGGVAQLDFRAEWALAAVPAAHPATGRLTLIADQRGGVYASPDPLPPAGYPADPATQGWLRVEAPEDLQRCAARLGAAP
jgi:hypothetical protein